MKNLFVLVAGKNYNLFYKLIVITLMFSIWGFGCVPKIHDPDHGVYSISPSDFAAEKERFEQTKGLSCPELPKIYDTSRLKVGSVVYDALRVNISDSEYYSTIKLDNIETSKEGQIYQQKILAPYLGERLYNIKPDELERFICYNKEKEGTTSKIIDFNMVGQEELMVADKPIVSRVYKFSKMTAGSGHYSGTKDSKILWVSEANDFYEVTNAFQTVWVSDEIPFGIVKTQTRSSTFTKASTNSFKREQLSNYEVIGFDSATAVNPVSIIQDIRNNGLGDRYFIKDIPISILSENLAVCFMKAESLEIGCATSSGWSRTFSFTHSHSLWHIEVPDFKDANYVALISPEKFKKIITRDSRSGLAEAVEIPENLIFLYPKEISISKNEKIPITIPLSDGSIHIILGSVKIGQYMFISEGGDKSNRLNFGIIEPYGYVYLQGKGKVILPNGREIILGY